MWKRDSLHFTVYFWCVFVLFFWSHSDIALRIEDYEEYFKQKHADSNCGFAEEYEVWETEICICLFFLFRHFFLWQYYQTLLFRTVT